MLGTTGGRAAALRVLALEVGGCGGAPETPGPRSPGRHGIPGAVSAQALDLVAAP